MQPWLDKSDIKDVVGDLPESFPYGKITPLVNLVVKGWLTDLLGKTKVAEIKAALESQYAEAVDVQPLSEDLQDWSDLIKPFLVLAAWSGYTRNSNVTYTKTGPVTKRTDYSDPIEKDQRSDISKEFYKDAKEWAARISAKRAKDSETGCKRVITGSQRRSVTIVKGKQKSYFLDGPHSDC